MDLVFATAFSHDGQRVASGSSEGLVKIWDVETEAEVSSLVGVRWGEAMGVLCGCGLFPTSFTFEVV